MLSRLGLDRPELRAWAMYDWANSAFWSTVVTAVFPEFFSSVAGIHLPRGVATARFAAITTIALTLVAIMSPVLGAIADYAGVKKKMLAVFLAIGATATAAMVLIGEGDWKLAAILFMVSNIGVAGTLVFYDSLLPYVARPEEIDRVSTAGFAIGFLGGGLLLALNLAWISKPEWFGLRDAVQGIHLSFFSVAVWWVVFSIPLFRRVPEPPRRLRHDERGNENPVLAGISRLADTFRNLRRYRHAFLMLIAFLLYNDGIQTIIRMATPYGAEIGIGREALIAAILLVQFVGVPFTFLFGMLADRVGTRPSIYLALCLHGDLHPGVLDDLGHAVFRSGNGRGDGAGRQPGAQPVALREHDSAPQVVRSTSASSRCSRSSPASSGQSSSPSWPRSPARAGAPSFP